MAWSSASACAESTSLCWRIRYSWARKRVSGVRRSWAMLSHTPLTSCISRSMRSSMALTMAASMSSSSRRADNGRRWVRSPATISSAWAWIARIRLSGLRRSRYQPAKPGISVKEIPQSRASRMIRVTTNSEPLSRNSTSQRPSCTLIATASQLSRGRCGSSASRQRFNSWILPSSLSSGGRARTLPPIGLRWVSNRP